MATTSATGSVRELPANPNITHLKGQAKDLQRAVRAGDRSAIARVHASHPAPDNRDGDGFSLRDAQLTLAREYGFESWNDLNREVGERMIEERDLHRWFGVQLNNGMWDFIDDPSVGPDLSRERKEELLYSAYASAYHWRKVGNEANQARGEHLISRMAVKIGDYETARRHAERCLELVTTHTEVMEEWDEPFAHEALARALAAQGEIRSAQSHRDLAIEQTTALGDPEDREILEAELAREPWFGLI
jgi:hypothetical protein